MYVPVYVCAGLFVYNILYTYARLSVCVRMCIEPRARRPRNEKSMSGTNGGGLDKHFKIKLTWLRKFVYLPISKPLFYRKYYSRVLCVHVKY